MVKFDSQVRDWRTRLTLIISEVCFEVSLTQRQDGILVVGMQRRRRKGAAGRLKIRVEQTGSQVDGKRQKKQIVT